MKMLDSNLDSGEHCYANPFYFVLPIYMDLKISILVNFSIKCETLLLARYHGGKLETKHPGQ